MRLETNEERVDLHSADGAAVVGIFRSARGKGRAAVLLLHGITTHKDEFGGFFRDLAASLSMKGASSLRIDFRGHGESNESADSFGVATQVLDILSAAKWLQAITGQPVHIVACSFGSPAAISYASNWKESVESLTLISPVLDFRRTFLMPESDWAREIFSEEALRKVFETNSIAISGSFIANARFVVDLMLIKPTQLLKELEIPVTLIHGDSDSMVPFSISEAAASFVPSARFVAVPGMDHGYWDSDDENGTSEASRKNYALIVEEIVRQLR